MARILRPGAAAVGALALLLLNGVPSAAQQGAAVDLELVLAVDTSSSVSPHEFDLQMRGFAEAFRNPAVIHAIRAAGDLGVAVSLIQWSDNLNQVVAVDWTLVRDQESALTFSRQIDRAPRFLVGGSTAIGGALKFALRQLERNGFRGRRQVIDVSGDGRTNQGVQPDDIRDIAVDQGITVNGLAILNEDAYVDRYYLSSVIGGTGAFVMSAADYRDFASAILEKLIKEIVGVPIAARPPPGELLGGLPNW